MESLKKHLIVFLAYQHFDIVKESFESISEVDADIFIVENKSDCSKQISDYFTDKNHKGYIQFHTNIANSAISIFIDKFWNILTEYEYITITDGDLYVYDVNDMFAEIFDALKNKQVLLSSADLWQGNHYLNNVRLGFDDFLNESKNNQTKFGSVSGHTGNFFVTIRNENLNLLKQRKLYLDSYLAEVVNSNNGYWYKTNKNKIYHLTWDLYFEGNPYFDFKKQVYDKIWFKEQYCEFDVLKEFKS
jgi:hypothetical protein